MSRLPRRLNPAHTIVTLTAFVAACEAERPEPVGQDEPRLARTTAAEPERVAVRWARWGRDGSFEDVTVRVRELVAAGQDLRADRQLLEAGDPAPGRDKNLILLLEVDGRSWWIHLAKDGGHLRIESGNEAPPDGVVRVHEARWGSGGRVEDVSGRVERLVAAGDVLRADRDHLQAGDPAPGKDKVLRAVLHAAGRSIHVELTKGGGKVEFAPASVQPPG